MDDSGSGGGAGAWWLLISSPLCDVELRTMAERIKGRWDEGLGMVWSGSTISRVLFSRKSKAPFVWK